MADARPDLASRLTATRFLTAVLMVAVCHDQAAAQVPVHRVEIFVAYSRLPADGDDYPRAASNGAHVEVAGAVTRSFGVFGELAYYRNTTSDFGPSVTGLVANTTVTQWSAGPRFTARFDPVNVFLHGLVGISRGGANDAFAGFADSGLTVGGGAGLDIAVHRRVGVRGQFDFLGSFADIVETNARMSVGAVFRF